MVGALARLNGCKAIWDSSASERGWWRVSFVRAAEVSAPQWASAEPSEPLEALGPRTHKTLAEASEARARHEDWDEDDSDAEEDDRLRPPPRRRS